MPEPSADLLDDDHIDDFCRLHRRWSYDGTALTAQVEAPTFLDAIDDGDIPRKGEFVVIVGGSEDAGPPKPDSGKVLEVLAEALPAKQAAAIAAKLTGEKRNSLYRKIIERYSEG